MKTPSPEAIDTAVAIGRSSVHVPLSELLTVFLDPRCYADLFGVDQDDDGTSATRVARLLMLAMATAGWQVTR